IITCSNKWFKTVRCAHWDGVPPPLNQTLGEERSMPVPELNMYYPSEDAMDKKQAAFYKFVEASLKKGEYINVEGNIGYVFTYLYKLLSKWNKSGYESLSEFLIYASEIYKHEKKLSDYCLF